MKFIYYDKKNLQEFESKLKSLALEKNYKFHRNETILNKDEILSETSSRSVTRSLLKEFDEDAKVYLYGLQHRKSNYLIFIGVPTKKNVVGVRVVFDRKLFKQIAKQAIAIPAMVMTGPFIGFAIGATALASTGTRMLTIRGPLGKPIKNIITDTLGEPIEQDKS